MCGFQTAKFVKVFSLEAYLLYGSITRDNKNIYFFQSEIQSSQGFGGACKWESLFGLNLESIILYTIRRTTWLSNSQWRWS